MRTEKERDMGVGVRGAGEGGGEEEKKELRRGAIQAYSVAIRGSGDRHPRRS